MDAQFKPSSPFPVISKISLKRRIIFALIVLLSSVAVDLLTNHYGQHPTVLADLIVLIFMLVIVFRPQLIDRWNEKDRQETENCDPDLRK